MVSQNSPLISAGNFEESLHEEAQKALEQATYLTEDAHKAARSALSELKLRFTIDNARWALFDWTADERAALSRDLTEISAGALASQEIARRITNRVAHEYWEEYQEAVKRDQSFVSTSDDGNVGKTFSAYEIVSSAVETAVHDTGIELRLSIRENAPLSEAQELFDLYGGIYDALIVTSEAGYVVGILRKSTISLQTGAQSVDELFTPAFPTITRATPYVQALDLMNAHQVCVLPVVNEQGRLVGYVTKALAEIAQTEGTTRTELTRLELYMARVG